jgi:hypothetical protein
MKKIMILLAVLLASFAMLSAQSIAEYTFSTTTDGTLDDMSGSIDLLAPGTYYDDTASPVTDIGFTFALGASAYTQFSVNSNGQMQLGSTAIGGGASTPGANLARLAPISGDNAIRATGRMHYKVVGSAPNRRLVVEWLDLRVNYSNAAETGTYSRMQAWLYEGSNNIKFVYGTMWNMSTSAQSRSVYVSTSNVVGSLGQVTTITTTPTWTNNATSLTATSFPASSAMLNLSSDTEGARRVFHINYPVYTTPPNPAVLLSPTQNSWALTNAVLSWQSGGGGASSYDVYFGTSSNPPFVVNQASTSYTPSLNEATTYYWKIVARNEHGAAEATEIRSFRTPNSSQLAESFEATTFPPAGWANPGTWSRSTTTPIFHGTAQAYKYGSSSTKYILSTPMLTINNGDELSFASKVSGVTGTIEVIYSTDRTNWEVLETIAHTTANIYQNNNVDLSGIEGNYYLGFRNGLQAVSYYIDSVFGPEITPLVPGAPILSAPADLAVNQSTYPTFTWTAPATGGIPTGYNLYLDTDDGRTLYASNVTSPYTVTSPLAYEATYYWTVEAFNSAGSGDPAPARSFSVMADPTIYALPYTDGFEDGNTNDAIIVNNWTQAFVTGTKNWTINSTNTTYNRTPRTGSFNATLAWSASTWLFRPVQLVGGTSYDVEVWARQDHVDTAFANLQISYGTEGTAVGMVNTIAAQTPLTNGDYQRVNGSFTPATSGIYYIGILGTLPTSTNWHISIDDITVRETPADPSFTYSPTEWAFGEVLVNGTASKLFTIGNNGGGFIDVESVVVDGDFFSLSQAFSPVSLGAGQSSTFTVVYNPTAGGLHSGTVTISDGRDTYVIELSASCFDPTITTFPWTESFGTATTDTFPPASWSRLAGQYPVASGTSTFWGRGNWLNGAVGNNAAKMNIYGTSRFAWLITPPIAIPADGFELKFDLGLTDYANANVIEDLTSQLDDKLIVVMSDSPNMTNPVILREYNNSGSEFVYNNIPNTGTSVTLPLIGITGTKYFAFYGESTLAGGDNDMHVDNVTVRETPAAPIFGITPASKDFGQVELGTTASQVFTISNSGAGVLGLSSIVITEGGEHFSITVPVAPEAMNLATGETATFTVQYAPTAVESNNGTININHDGGTDTVALSGEGYTRPAGSTYENPYLVTLPLVDFAGDTALYGDDYESNWVSPSNNYLAGDDMVLRFSLDQPSMISGTLQATVGTWIGMIFVNTAPNPTTPAPVLAAATSSGSLATLAATEFAAGTYSILLSTYPSPQSFQFVLNLNAVPIIATPPGVVSISYPANEATGLPIGGFNLSWTPDAAAGSPDYYSVYMSMDAESIYDDIYIETTETSYNPVAENVLTFNHNERWYWTVEAHNTEGSALLETLSWFQIQDVPQVITTFPWNEDFEAETFPPADWAIHNNDPNPTAWVRTIAQNHTPAGTASAYHAYDGSNDAEGWMITPAIQLPAAGDYVLSWWNFNAFPTYMVYNGVMIGTSSDPAHESWTEIWSATSVAQAWSNAVVPLNDYLGQTVHFAFVYEGYDADDWFVDDVSVYELLIDEIPPTITHLPLLNTPTTDAPYTVAASIVDDSTWNNAIAGANMYYTTDGSLNWGAAVPMTLTEGVYYAQIPAQMLGTAVNYKIEAEDSEGNLAVSNTFSFSVANPTWVWYDQGGTTYTGYTAYNFGPTVVFNNPFFGTGMPLHLLGTDGSSYYGNSADLVIYSYDGVDMVPVYTQPVTFGVQTYDTFDISAQNVMIDTPYFMVAYENIPMGNYILFDGTYDYGTSFVKIDGELFTLSSSGSWAIGAFITNGESTDLDSPVLSLALSASNQPELSWIAVTGANGYIVEASADPYASTWTNLGTVAGTSFTYTGTEPMKFFRVTATDAASTRISSSTVMNIQTRSIKADLAPKTPINLRK